MSSIYTKSGTCEIVFVFTPNYELNEQEYGIINGCTKEIHGLRFKRYSIDKGLWISNNGVKNILNK